MAKVAMAEVATEAGAMEVAAKQKAEQEKNKQEGKDGDADKGRDNKDVIIKLEKDEPAMVKAVMQILKKDFEKSNKI